MKSPGNLRGGRREKGERERAAAAFGAAAPQHDSTAARQHRTAGRYQGIDVAPSVVADGVDVGGGCVALAADPVPVPVLILVLVGAPPGPVDRVSASPGSVVLGVGGADGDCSGSRSDGTGDG
ncbi:hypothetical protein [Streptomyces sp. MNU77]|uniref:hypothetical protein n=1 Tax=Streptomyces sp. MNU77 TaxID=1573406 RepID=UPI0015BC443D|nr:hypothetical protein [Streptomyces sp. MNU77]